MVSLITTPLSSSGIKDVYITEKGGFAYIVTSAGVDVISLVNTTKVVASGKLPNTPTAITANWQDSSGQLFIGTVSSGIFAMNYHRSRSGDFTEELQQRFTTSTAPPISSNKINDLDTLSGSLLVGTDAGVDFIYDGTNYSTRALISGSSAVHLTTGGAGYWTTVSGNQGEVEVNYDLIATTGTNILGVDFSYSNSSNPSLPGEPPSDIAISELSGSPIALAFSTASGVLVTEELQFNEASARRKTFLSEDASSVDFSDPSSFATGRVYVLVTGTLGLRVFNLEDSSLSDIHPQENVNLPFTVRASRDQFVASGTNTIIRTTGLA